MTSAKYEVFSIGHYGIDCERRKHSFSLVDEFTALLSVKPICYVETPEPINCCQKEKENPHPCVYFVYKSEEIKHL